MRTRCPACGTVFRVTSEQLRLKAGKVRCGHCQAVFNAFEELLTDAPAAETVSTPFAAPPIESLSDESTVPLTPEWVAPEWEPPIEHEAALATDEVELGIIAEPESAAAVADELESVPESLAEAQPESAVFLPDEPVVLEAQAEPTTRFIETPEESTLAAREAGLVAARELNEAPGYNRWAVGTLTGNGLGDFDNDSAHRTVWPFVMVGLLLLVVLLGQLLYYFRTEMVQRWPSSVALFSLAAVDVPLPQNSELVAIEASDLQSDNARGLFVLQATLHNRAAYAQAWPALELTLTDTNDTVVSRRVLVAADYLPPATDPAAFPANGETAIKLWVEAKEIGAAGYRLYIFYP